MSSISGCKSPKSWASSWGFGMWPMDVNPLSFHSVPQSMLASLCHQCIPAAAFQLQHSSCTPELVTETLRTTLGKLLLPQFPFPPSHHPPVPLVAPGATFPPPAGFNLEAGGGFSISWPLSQASAGDESSGRAQGWEGSCSRDRAPVFAASPRQETSKRARHPQLPAAGS